MRRRVVSAGPGRTFQLDRHGQPGQSLLGSVVQIALQPPTLVVVGSDDRGPRQAQALELRTQVRLQPLVVERQPRGVLERVHELWIV